MATPFFDIMVAGSPTRVSRRIGGDEKFPVRLRLAIIVGLSMLLWGAIIFCVAS